MHFFVEDDKDKAFLIGPEPSWTEVVVQFEPWHTAVVIFAAPLRGVTDPSLYKTLDPSPILIIRPSRITNAEECSPVSMRSPSITTVKGLTGTPFSLTSPPERRTACDWANARPDKIRNKLAKKHGRSIWTPER